MQNITDMTLDEQIGQLFVVGFAGTSPTPEIIDMIEQHHVGGVILFTRNIGDARQVTALTHALQGIARAAGQRWPLLITTDQENGIVRRLGEGTTIFPGNMALGAIGADDVAFDVAQATGREMLALGINMNLAPVVDVNNNPANPVIGVRSFGEDPQLVARLGAATARGYRAAGVIATLKHFPGHGDTAADSHLSLPVIPYPLERVEAWELVPFQQGIAAGADCIMIAHVAFPHITGDAALPATISAAVVQGLLREQMGFDGVIISDCLEMQAISDTVGVSAGAVQALQAGNDLILISHRYDRQLAGIAAVRAAVQAGSISSAAITQAATRVQRLKERYRLTWDAPTAATPTAAEREGYHLMAATAYDRAVTLVRNDAGLIPLQLAPDQRVLVLAQQAGNVTQAVDIPFNLMDLAASIKQRHDDTDAIAISPQPGDNERARIMQAIAAADLIVMATLNAHLDPPQAAWMHTLSQAGKPIIGIAVCNPYDLAAFPALQTYMATYEYTAPALAAATRVLFGAIAPQGHLPVSIPGSAPLA